MKSGRYRIRTRVTGLEGQHDIQTTPIARDLLREPHLDEPSLRLEPACTLRAPCWPGHSPPFPCVPTFATDPLPLWEAFENLLSQPHEYWRVSEFRRRCDLADYARVQVIMIQQTSSMEELVG